MNYSVIPKPATIAAISLEFPLFVIRVRRRKVPPAKKQPMQDGVAANAEVKMEGLAARRQQLLIGAVFSVQKVCRMLYFKIFFLYKMVVLGRYGRVLHSLI